MNKAEPYNPPQHETAHGSTATAKSGRSAHPGSPATFQPVPFTAFPNEDWKAATPPSLHLAVSELREKFCEHVRGHFEKSEQSGLNPKLTCVYASDIKLTRQAADATVSAYDELHYCHNKGREAQILAQHLARLQKWIADDAILSAMEFRKIASRNAIGGDPLNWAYGQLHSLLYEFLGLPEGGRIGFWLGQACDGRPALNSDLFADNRIALVKAHLRCQVLSALRGCPAFVAVYLHDSSPEWLPAHLLPPRSQSENNGEEWPRLDKQMSEEVLKTFVRDFWMELEAKLIANMQNIRISRAQLPAEIILPMPPAESIARQKYCQPILNAKGWSRLDFAKEAQLDWHTINDYLEGKSNPHRFTLKKMAEALGISVNDLPL